jgi:hypothetical protein
MHQPEKREHQAVQAAGEPWQAARPSDCGGHPDMLKAVIAARTSAMAAWFSVFLIMRMIVFIIYIS